MLADEIVLPERDVRATLRAPPTRERPMLRFVVHRESSFASRDPIGSSAETPGRGEKPSASAESPISA